MKNDNFDQVKFDQLNLCRTYIYEIIIEGKARMLDGCWALFKLISIDKMMRSIS